MPLKALLVCLVSAWALACGGSSSDSAGPSQPGSGGTAGGPKLAWDQSAPGTDELRQYSYVLYVDGTAVPLPGAACGTLAAETLAAACTAPLPAMSAGQHTLEMATRITRDGVVLESARSEPITYTAGASGFASGTLGATGVSASPVRVAPALASTQAAPGGDPQGQNQVIVETIVTGLDRPSAIAALPDGRLLIAEHGGVVRIAESGALLPEPAARLDDADPAADARVSVALAPDFESSRHIYVGYAAVDDRGSRSGRIVRFREAGGMLAEAAVVADGLPAPVSAPWVAIGPDSAIYVGTSSTDAGEAADLGSYAGKILRLALDGTTPAGNPFPSSPIYSAGYRDTAGPAWDPRTGHLWVVDTAGSGDGASAGSALVLAAAGGAPRRVAEMGFTGPARLAFVPTGGGPGFPFAWRGSLMIAVPEQEGLLRVSGLDVPALAASASAASIERLFGDRFGPVGLVEPARQGFLVATARSTGGIRAIGADAVYLVREHVDNLPRRRESP
jgi:hypothetical protein